MWEFRLGNIEDLKILSKQLDVSVEAKEDVSILAEPVKVGKLVIPNSLAVQKIRRRRCRSALGRGNGSGAGRQSQSEAIMDQSKE